MREGVKWRISRQGNKRRSTGTLSTASNISKPSTITEYDEYQHLRNARKHFEDSILSYDKNFDDVDTEKAIYSASGGKLRPTYYSGFDPGFILNEKWIYFSSEHQKSEKIAEIATPRSRLGRRSRSEFPKWRLIWR